MKETIKTSRASGYLEKIFRVLNTHTSDQMKKDTASRMQNYYDNLTLKKA